MNQASANAAAAATTASAGATTPAAAAAAAASAAPEQGKTYADGVQAERARVTAILGHANAAANPSITQQCIATGLSAEQAKGFLDAAPAAAAAPAAPAHPFAAAMAAMGNPDVSGVEAVATQADAGPAAISAGWDRAFGVNSK